MFSVKFKVKDAAKRTGSFRRAPGAGSGSSLIRRPSSAASSIRSNLSAPPLTGILANGQQQQQKKRRKSGKGKEDKRRIRIIATTVKDGSDADSRASPFGGRRTKVYGKKEWRRKGSDYQSHSRER